MMIYKRSPHYRRFIRENLWLADFPHKGPVMRNFDVFFALGLSKQTKNGDWDAMKPMWQYYNDVIWARWRLKSPASRLFTQPFIQGADQIKYQRSMSLASVRGIQRWQVNSPHKGPVTRKMFPFDDVIMNTVILPAMFSKHKVLCPNALSAAFLQRWSVWGLVTYLSPAIGWNRDRQLSVTMWIGWDRYLSIFSQTAINLYGGHDKNSHSRFFVRCNSVPMDPCSNFT